MSKKAKPIIGYSCENNDQHNKPYPVTELTPQQKSVQAARDALLLQIDQAEQQYTEALRKLGKLKKACDHSVFNDAAGYLYDNRSCFICGQKMGFI